MFAFPDDTKCFMKIVSELDIQNFKKTCLQFPHGVITINLAFSIPKFVFLRYHNKFNSEYSINGNIITCSDSCKDLGIYFSDNLLWRLHLQNITSNLKHTNHLVYCVGGHHRNDQVPLGVLTTCQNYRIPWLV